MAFLVLLPVFFFGFCQCVFCCVCFLLFNVKSLPCDYSCVVVGVYEELSLVQIFLPEGDFRDETPLHFPLGGENPKLHMLLPVL